MNLDVSERAPHEVELEVTHRIHRRHDEGVGAADVPSLDKQTNSHASTISPEHQAQCAYDVGHRPGEREEDKPGRLMDESSHPGSLGERRIAQVFLRQI